MAENKKVNEIRVYTLEELNEEAVDFREVNKKYDEAIEAIRDSKAVNGMMDLNKALIETTFIIPHGKEDGKNRMTPLLMNGTDGTPALPIYTSLQDLAKMEQFPLPEGVTAVYVVVPYLEVCKFLLALKAPRLKVLVNSGFNGGVYDAIEFLHIEALVKKEERLNAMLQEGTVPNGMNLQFIDARTFPTRVVNAVYDVCVNELKDVERVFYKACKVANFNCFAFIVEGGEDFDAIRKSIHTSASNVSNGATILVLPITKDLEKIIGEDVAIYDREFDGLW